MDNAMHQSDRLCPCCGTRIAIQLDRIERDLCKLLCLHQAGMTPEDVKELNDRLAAQKAALAGATKP